MKHSQKELTIVGVGGQAIAAIDVARQTGVKIKGLIKPPEHLGPIPKIFLNSEIPILELNDIDEFSNMPIFIAVGDNSFRFRIFELLQKMGAQDFPNLVSPSSTISQSSNMGRGNFIGNFGNIGPGSSIGDFAIINTRASVDHENQISDFVSLAPASTTGGKVAIGFLSFVGMNSSLRQKVSVGQNCLIGAHSYVHNSIPDNSLAWGVPAKVQSKRRPGANFQI